jgi:hypothetical protein
VLQELLGGLQHGLVDCWSSAADKENKY